MPTTRKDTRLLALAWQAEDFTLTQQATTNRMCFVLMIAPGVRTAVAVALTHVEAVVEGIAVRLVQGEYRCRPAPSEHDCPSGSMNPDGSRDRHVALHAGDCQRYYLCCSAGPGV
jgi:hypothetical protein